jgi:hypothetical protein
MSLTRNQVAGMIEELRGRVRHEPCWTCDCLQGFLTQLELDAEEDVSDLTGPLKIDRGQMHGCLGCDPCPPGEVYSDYLRGGDCDCGKECSGDN